MRVLHCWKGETDHLADVHGWGTDAYWEAWGKLWLDQDTCIAGTCMLPKDHPEPHSFTPDGAIGVSFEAPS